MVTPNRLPGPGDLILGRYRIEEQIGRGGFGAVFKATQTGLQRTVALKILLPSAMLQEEMVERFRREAVLARNLNHPNTIRLYDFGQTETGLLFIAMEYLNGLPLDQFIKESGPLEIERVQRIGVQILKSLAEAHQHNVIHRDIKPSNIFICDDVVGEPDFVKVLDFGIAKAFGESENSRLTQTGMGFGTPFYMAPEQIRSKGICPATDLYALGLVLSELLTGKTVYSGESSMDIAVKQLSEEPPPLPEWVLRGPVGPVLQRSTQKSLHARYPSAVEMLRDLRGVDPHASIDVSAKIDGRKAAATASGGGSSRVPMLVAACAVAFLMLVAVGVGLAFMTGMFESAETDPKPVAQKPEPQKAEPQTGHNKAAEAGQDEQKPPEEAKLNIGITTEPAGASVYHGEEYLGSTPLRVPFAPSKDGVTLRIEKDTFQEHLLEVSLDQDHEYVLELKPVDDTDLGKQLTKDVRKETGGKKPAGRNGTTKKPAGGAKPVANNNAKKPAGGQKPAGNNTKKPAGGGKKPAGGGKKPADGGKKPGGTINIPKL